MYIQTFVLGKMIAKRQYVSTRCKDDQMLHTYVLSQPCIHVMKKFKQDLEPKFKSFIQIFSIGFSGGNSAIGRGL